MNTFVRNQPGPNGSVYITDTDAHAGSWMAVQAVAAAVIDPFVADDVSGTLTTVPIPAGVTIYGLFTSIKLTSGKVIAYRKA